jgi:hypothetical protein
MLNGIFQPARESGEVCAFSSMLLILVTNLCAVSKDLGIARFRKNITDGGQPLE